MLVLVMYCLSGKEQAINDTELTTPSVRIGLNYFNNLLLILSLKASGHNVRNTGSADIRITFDNIKKVQKTLGLLNDRC
jgi:hypothetical protein